MTRLVLIHGTKATVFDDAQEIHQWDTKDPAHPVDAWYYQELEPLVFNAEWQQSMTDSGRRFKTRHLDEIYF